ncbi:MAG: RsmE family RNA methyltransferase [Chlamydiales bacterium]|nr:16S rRNA (uracil(1498)-N(3))-methyltransferase [Chlamydiales bacterium]NCF70358.1 RsmE family RNA methyltransferase [Chlamydiales bacterium]
MPAYRFFCDQELIENNLVNLSEKESHHLFHVMKLKVGNDLEIVNGNGFLGKATLKEVKKKKATALINLVEFYQKQLPPFSLIQAFCKEKKRLHLILEKACEIGIHDFYYFSSEKGADYTQVSRSEDKLKEIAIAAMKQSGRLYLPKLHFLENIKQLKQINNSIFYGSLDKKSPLLLTAVSSIKDQEHHPHILVGPEAGFSTNELSVLDQIGALPISLGPNILRTETASISSLAVISQYLQTLQ